MDLFASFPGPFPIEAVYGKVGYYLVALLIGFGFGYVLEIAGFGNSTKLAAQFYLTDMTVFKVMFTAILVAMVLVFGATGLGLLDFNRVHVNPTYLWPGIVGGIIMGVGFVIGGFCPGTSLVAVSTLKKDGMFFVVGLFIGIFAFGETVDSWLSSFWNSSNMGRFTLPELFGLPTGVVVVAIVVMAVFLFWLVEKAEAAMGGEKPKKEHRPYKLAGAGLIIMAALAVLFVGQPTVADRWEQLAAQKQPLLDNRQVYIHPGELLEYIYNDRVEVVMLDVRSESDYNLFHVQDASHVSLEELPGLAQELLQQPPNTLVVTMSNDEVRSTEAWKILTAESLVNVYILEGGVNNWLATFNVEPEGAEAAAVAMLPTPIPGAEPGRDSLRYTFPAALGAKYPAARPELHEFEYLEFVPKIELKVKQATGGG